MAVPGHERARLDSWKEIAEYLGRDVRTVVRWEKEKGLPVHTVPGLRRRSVFAYPDELDTWLEGSPLDNGHPEESTTSGENGLPKRFGSLWLLGFAGMTFAALLALAYVASIRPASTVASASVEKVSLQENRLMAWDRNGGLVWSYDFPRPLPKFHTAALVPHIGEIAGEEYVVNIINQTGVAENFLSFSSTGRLLWQHAPQDVLTFGKETFSPPWSLRAMHHVSLAGKKHTALALTHHTWWPSVLVLLDPQGRPVGRFVNSGWIKWVDSFDGPNGPLLIAGGANNALNGGMAAILDARHLAGSSPEKPGSEFECKGCAPGRPLKYFVFPRSELNIATASTFNFAGGSALGNRIVIHALEVESPQADQRAAAIYEFSLDFQLLRASFGDRYWDLHRKLELEGQLKHTQEQCPDRRGPRKVLSWDPQNGWKELRPD